MIRKHITEYKFYDGVRAAKTISASSFSKDVLELYLAATESPKPGTFGRGAIGSIFHMGMEHMFKSHPSTKSGRFVQEERVERPLSDYMINGKTDLVDYMDHIIYDWKGMSASAYATFKSNKKDHRINIQMAVYNWLLGGDFTAEAHCFITDWDPVKPTHPASAYQIVKCNIMTAEETRDYMAAKIKELEGYLKSSKLPPKCDNVMPRFVKDGMYVDSKCAYYCDYSHVCKRKRDDTAKTLGLKWGRS